MVSVRKNLHLPWIYGIWHLVKSCLHILDNVLAKFISSGRVVFLPNHKYCFNCGAAMNLPTGAETKIIASKIVDGTVSDIKIPLKGAILSKEELAKLRTISKIIRMGHVASLPEDGLTMQFGGVPMPSKTVYIDCTTRAYGASNGILPVFESNRISLNLLYPFGTMCFACPLCAQVGMLDISADKTHMIFVSWPNHAKLSFLCSRIITRPSSATTFELIQVWCAGLSIPGNIEEVSCLRCRRCFSLGR